MRLCVSIEAVTMPKLINNNALYQALLNLKWRYVRVLLKRSDSHYLARYCETIFHVACAHDAPVDIIKSILNILCPNQVLHQKDMSENTPLHLTLRYSSDEKVPLFLLKVSPSISILTNRLDNLPLHSALIHKRNTKIIRGLLQSFPQGIKKVNNDGHTPPDLFFKIWQNDLLKMREKHCHCFRNIQEDHEDYTKMNYVKEILLLFAYVSVHGVWDERQPEKMTTSPLHNIIQIKDLPKVFLLLIMDLFPTQIRIKDKDGNYPLHIAVMQKHCSLEMVETMCFEDIHSHGFHNKCGRHAFTLAIENGVEWESKILQMLVERDPECISRIDGKVGLSPFGLACCSNKTSLDVAYKLLMMDPSIIKTV